MNIFYYLARIVIGFSMNREQNGYGAGSRKDFEHRADLMRANGEHERADKFMKDYEDERSRKGGNFLVFLIPIIIILLSLSSLVG